jgi:hypothetical protein
MREVVGDLMETPSWGSAFPGGEGALSQLGKISVEKTNDKAAGVPKK